MVVRSDVAKCTRQDRRHSSGFRTANRVALKYQLFQRHLFAGAALVIAGLHEHEIRPCKGCRKLIPIPLDGRCKLGSYEIISVALKISMISSERLQPVAISSV